MEDKEQSQKETEVSKEQSEVLFSKCSETNNSIGNNIKTNEDKNEKENDKEKKKRQNKITKEEKKRENKNIEEVTDALVEMNVSDIMCGPSWIKFNWLQSLASREMYLLNYCFVGLVMGMFFTYSVSTISTIEKRFKLSSKWTGFMLSGNDVSQVLFAVLISYYGNYGNRPKWMGFGILAASLSCLLCTMPHFLYGPGQDAIDVAKTSQAMSINQVMTMSNSSKFGLCYAPYGSDCSEDNVDNNSTSLGPVFIFFFGQFFVGIAVSVFYSIGLVYLDDNINKEDSPIYYAVSMIVRVCGPVLGFFMGSKCLSIYIDPNYEPNISLRDPRWLGAWWLGYIILTILLCICGSIMLLFPKTLPITMYKMMQQAQIRENPKATGEITKNSNLEHLLNLVKFKQRKVKPSLKELPRTLKRLFTNKVWLGYGFNTCLDLLALIGYWSFKPKYLEYQFRMSASIATFYTGVAGLISSIVGFGISGLILKWFEPRPRTIAAYACLLTLFSSATMFLLMFISCPQLQIIGPDYQDNSTSMVPGCNQDCDCSDRYAPVCSEDGLKTFYSSCYAGCTKVNASAAPVEYSDCKCILPLTEPAHNNSSGIDKFQQYGKAIQGYCPDKCDGFYYYIIAVTVTKLIGSTGRIGGTLLYLRSVEEHDKGIALGTLTMMLSLFAFIPGPIITGAIVDSACIIWDNTCGKKGNCWLYDSQKFRILIHAVPAGIIFLAMAGDIMVFLNCKGLDIYGKKDKVAATRSSEEVELKSLTNHDTVSSNNECTKDPLINDEPKNKDSV